METKPPHTPWVMALQALRGFEDCYAMMHLYQTGLMNRRLPTANGETMEALTAPTFLSERSLAELLATRMRVLTGDESWTYANFLTWIISDEANSFDIKSFLVYCRSKNIIIE